jgi:hypothetical protein
MRASSAGPRRLERASSSITLLAMSALMVATEALGQANRNSGSKPRPHMP